MVLEAAIAVADIRVGTGEVAAACATDCVEAVVMGVAAPGHWSAGVTATAGHVSTGISQSDDVANPIYSVVACPQPIDMILAVNGPSQSTQPIVVIVVDAQTFAGRAGQFGIQPPLGYSAYEGSTMVRTLVTVVVPRHVSVDAKPLKNAASECGHRLLIEVVRYANGSTVLSVPVAAGEVTGIEVNVDGALELGPPNTVLVIPNVI